MSKATSTILLIIMLSLFASQLPAQSVFDSDTNLDSYVQNLVQQVADLDPVYHKIDTLLNIQLPTQLKRDPEFYDTAENRFRQVSYQLGLLSARSNFLYASIGEIKKMKDEYQRNNPLLNVNYDTRSTMNNNNFQNQLINAKLEMYDSAISFVQKLYKKQQRKSVEIVESSRYRKLNGYLASYNQYYVYGKSANEIARKLSTISIEESNRAVKDAGGMTPSQYKLRAFALEVLIPVFESAKKTRDPHNYAEAVAKIFRVLPKGK